MSLQQSLIDSFGRSINYFRISLTERCNFRCVYCVPNEGIPAISKSDYLTQDEIIRFVRIMGKLGIYRFRLTGGEPLLRKDVVDIVKQLKMIRTVKDLSITTNGSLLTPLIQPLKEAGLDRINISFDSFNPERFKEITLSNSYHTVLEATHLALQAGFPVKLNMVALRGMPRDDIIRFVQLAKEYPLEVRFLEFMPLCGSGWQKDLVIPIHEIRSVIKEHFHICELHRNGDVAQTFSIEDGKGKVGFIGSLTESFCETCSRMRLSSDGQIFPCLFSHVRVSVKDLLRNNASEDEIVLAVREAARIKPAGNQFIDRPFQKKNGSVNTQNPLIHNIGG